MKRALKIRLLHRTVVLKAIFERYSFSIMKSSSSNGITFLHGNWNASKAVLEQVYTSDTNRVSTGKSTNSAKVQSVMQNTQVLFLCPQ